MILQKFVAITSIGNLLQEKCYNKDDEQFLFDMLDNKTFDELDALMKLRKKQTESTLLLLSEQKDMEHCHDIIKGLSKEERFILGYYLNISALYDGYHIEMLPLFPIEKLPFNYFAYLEKAFSEFQHHCQKRGLSLAEEAFSLSLDNFEQQNI